MMVRFFVKLKGDFMFQSYVASYEVLHLLHDTGSLADWHCSLNEEAKFQT